MMKRFCDACSGEIPQKEVYLDVMITPKKGEGEGGPSNYYGDYCIGCVRKGDATKQLMKEYEDDKKTTPIREKNSKSD